MPAFATVLSLIFVVAGAGLSVLAVQHLLKRWAFLQDAERATGVVVRLEESPDEDGLCYFPVVRFTTPTGREVTFQSQMASRGSSVKVGDAIDVRHRRDRPDIAEVASFVALWGPTLLCGVLGLSFLFVGAGLLLGWLPAT